MLRNIYFLILIILVLTLNVYKAFAQSNSNPIPTPTNFIPRMCNYPTPDWGKRKRGYDYEPNKVLVKLKNGISLTEKNRVEKEMSKFGEVRNTAKYIKNMNPNLPHRKRKQIPPGYNFGFYVIKITNGMTEKEVIDFLKADPAVEVADVNSLIRYQY